MELSQFPRSIYIVKPLISPFACFNIVLMQCFDFCVLLCNFLVS